MIEACERTCIEIKVQISFTRRDVERICVKSGVYGIA